ncbi:MAG: sigma-70 family RNA polymerase sigma factor [Acidimicrobiales bacterium]
MGALPVVEPWDTSLTAPPVPVAFERFSTGYEDFFRQELRPLVALATAIAGADRGEEIAQEALLRAHREWDRIARYDKPGAWARRVTLNLATSSQRRRSAERRALQRVATRRQLDAPPPEVDDFWTLVRRLPDRQAAAVALHYLEDLSVAEIADALGCAEGTAKAHLHKARRTLAEHLRNQEPPR